MSRCSYWFRQTIIIQIIMSSIFALLRMFSDLVKNSGCLEMGLGIGPGPKLAQAQIRPRQKWAWAQIGPGPYRARAQTGPGPKWDPGSTEFRSYFRMKSYDILLVIVNPDSRRAGPGSTTGPGPTAEPGSPPGLGRPPGPGPIHACCF